MRKALAILFLMLFTFQVLPLKVLGKLLNSKQSTEQEVEDDAEGSGDGKVFKYGEDHLLAAYAFSIEASRLGFNKKISACIHREESLPSVHISDLLSPPPDL